MTRLIFVAAFVMPVSVFVVAILLLVPLVIMLDTSTVAVPMAVVIVLALIVWLDPVSADVGRLRPVAVVPHVVVVDRIPVALDPHECRALVEVGAPRGPSGAPVADQSEC